MGMAPQEMIESGLNDGRDFALVDYIRVILKHWRLEVGLFLATCLVTCLASLLLPKEYEATASILPPPENDPGSTLQALVGQSGAGALLGGLLSGGGIKDVFIAILKSRTMKDDVIKRFDLVKIYDYTGSKTPMLKAREKLEKMTDIRVSKEGAISVTISSYDAQQSADMANFYVANLDRLNTSINVTDAGGSRIFLEKRVAEAQKALKEAEERLKDYQSRSKAVVLEGQVKAAIEGAAMLEGQIVAAEVQLKTLQTYATQQNPDVIRLREGIDEMRRQLKSMGYGKEAARSSQVTSSGAMADFSMPLDSIPSTGLDLIRLIRDAKIQETIFTLLTQQLEQTKIAEAKDIPTVKILDRAVVPEWKSRPKVLLNTAVAALGSIFVGVFLAFFLEYLKGARRREVA
jgi:tyrosine-protein kinase Etk/Wzc